jgi:hypothetical protein
MVILIIMKQTVKELQAIVTEFSSKLRNLPADEFAAKPLPRKWSKKEVIGHLIDSAQNNLRRFIVGQYDNSSSIVYEQDFWVNANAYQQMTQDEIILLWKLLNERICAILTNMPAEHYRREVNTGKDAVQLHSLEWLAIDYVKHMKHHLNQVFTKSFDIIYP